MTKRSSLIGILLFFWITQSVNATSINKVRELFFKASYEKEAYFELKKTLTTTLFESQTQKQAYEASLLVLKAKHEGSVLNKISTINEGLQQLNSLIETNSNSIELRFLRFALEWHIPFYLLLFKHLDTDKQFILSNIHLSKQLQLPTELAKQLLEFLAESDHFTNEELKTISKSIF